MRNLWMIPAGGAVVCFIFAAVYGNYLAWTQGDEESRIVALVITGMWLTSMAKLSTSLGRNN